MGNTSDKVSLPRARDACGCWFVGRPNATYCSPNCQNLAGTRKSRCAPLPASVLALVLVVILAGCALKLTPMQSNALADFNSCNTPDGTGGWASAQLHNMLLGGASFEDAVDGLFVTARR